MAAKVQSTVNLPRTTQRSTDDAADPDDGKKPGVVDRLKGMLATARRRFPVVDHAVRAVEHYNAAQASMLSGAVTYFGLLSFFPILALAFAVLGFIVGNSAEAQQPVLDAMQTVLPGLFDDLDTNQIASAARTATIVGIVGFLYSGLGWLSALRGALQTMFAVPKQERGNFFVGKAIDLMSLGALGVVLLVSVGSSSVVTSLTGSILRGIGLDEDAGLGIVLRMIGLGLGLAASTVLFFVIFRLLGKPDLPARPLRHGAFFSAVGFEVLKLLATYLISNTATNDIYGPFALVIALLVWINYFARVAMLGASWAATTPPADEVVEERQALEAEQVLEELRPGHRLTRGEHGNPQDRPQRDRGALVTGIVLGAAAVGLGVSLRRGVEEGR